MAKHPALLELLALQAHHTHAMSQPPATPVKVPPSAASYTAATLDPDLRSNINARLILDGHVAK